ncbi:hypothetical protein L541_2830 [Bordetella hinzii CA90 BAL1384]|nr:hypothetical protein L541_2830 [Bordetella hinzii CA90 BAL1384]KCB33516.1 hypothetical protein L543_3428 [Bordetella hinzii L60]KCB52553.1 hypothetical protein L537_2907 [Bordetella hinzii 1277]
MFDRIQPRLAEGSGHGVSLLNILRGPCGAACAIRKPRAQASASPTICPFIR